MGGGSSPIIIGGAVGGAIVLIALVMYCRASSMGGKSAAGPKTIAEAGKNNQRASIIAAQSQADAVSEKPAASAWVTHTDPGSGKEYYHNTETDVTQWDKPPATGNTGDDKIL
jgi:hypothetical protein